MTSASSASRTSCRVRRICCAVDSFAHALRTHLSAVLEKEGVPHYLSAAGSLFTIFLGRTDPVRDYAEARNQSTAAYSAFFHAMLDGGVYLPPSAFEAWFVSAAHGEEAMSRIADAAPASARAAAIALDGNFRS